MQKSGQKSILRKIFCTPFPDLFRTCLIQKNNRTWIRFAEDSANSGYGGNIVDIFNTSLFFLWDLCDHGGHGHPLSLFSGGNPSNHSFLGYVRGEHILRVRGIKPYGKG